MTGGRSPRQKGKRIELWVAKIFGGKRSGYGNPTEPDVTTDTLGIESKKVADFPVFLEDALQTVKKRCRKDLIPIVVVKKTRDGARIYLDLDDYFKLEEHWRK